MSREDWEAYDQIRAERKDKKARRREEWGQRVAGDSAWRKCHDTHWQTTIMGEVLDYWPGTMKWRYRGKTQTGDVLKFIRRIIA